MVEIKELGLPGLNLEEIDHKEKQHHAINMKLLLFRKTDEDLIRICKNVS